MTARACQNEKVARRLWRGAAEGDPDSFRVLDPDIVLRTYGTGPNAGEFRGVEEVLKSLALTSQRADELRSELIDVLASDQGAMIHYRNLIRCGAKALDAQYFMWLEMDKGVVTEVVIVPFDQAMVDAFWKPS